MSYKIKYAYTCSRGRVRKNNEDNYWVLGSYLEKINGGMATIVEGETWKKNVPAFAVFDGMGGESCGETQLITDIKEAVIRVEPSSPDTN